MYACFMRGYKAIYINTSLLVLKEGKKSSLLGWSGWESSKAASVFAVQWQRGAGVC